MPHTGITTDSLILEDSCVCKKQIVHSIELVAQMGVGSGIEE